MLQSAISSVAEVFQAAAKDINVDTNADAQEILIRVAFLNQKDVDESVDIQATSGASAGATEDNIAAAMNGNAVITKNFTVSSADTDTTRLTQKKANGDFTITILIEGGTLDLGVTTFTAASQTPARYRCQLRDALNPTVGDIAVSRGSVSGGPKQYTVGALDTSAKTVDLDDTEGNGAPSSGAANKDSDLAIPGAGDVKVSDFPGWARDFAFDYLRGGVKTLLLDTATIVAEGAVTVGTFNIGTPLPPNARVTGHALDLQEVVAGGSISAATAAIGEAGGDIDEIMAAEDVFTGATVQQSAGTAGVNPTGNYGGRQLALTLTTTADDLDQATTGIMRVDVYFTIA